MEIHTDGFVFGPNPSDTGGGFTVCDEKGEIIIRREIYKPGFTNNEAELLGVLHAAMFASRGDKIITDSQNTIAWVKRGIPKARPDLKDYSILTQMIINFKGIQLLWRPRDDNFAGKINEKPRQQGIFTNYLT